MTGIWRRQVADIVVIVHFFVFLLCFLFLLSLSHLSFLPPPPSTHLHSTPTTTLTLACSLLIIAHQNRGSVTLLTPTRTQNHLALHHLPRTPVTKRLTHPPHTVESTLHSI